MYSNDKIAILITTHSDFEQLKKLCCALDYPKFDIYIHIDKKVSYNDLKINLKFSNLYIIENRIKVYWGDLSLFLAMHNLILSAYNNGGYFKYITLSGLDYPIKSNNEIYEILNNDKEYIVGRELFKSEYHKVNNCYVFPHPILNNILKVVYKLKKKRIKYRPLYIDSKIYKVYFAPTWLALSNEFVSYLIKFLSNHTEIEKYFKYAGNADELVIPTILFNSPFKDKALGIITDESIHYNNYPALHYLNYEPVVEVFDESSYDKIINSNKLFVRKITSIKSAKLIEMIDKYRNK